MTKAVKEDQVGQGCGRLGCLYFISNAVGSQPLRCFKSDVKEPRFEGGFLEPFLPPPCSRGRHTS